MRIAGLRGLVADGVTRRSFDGRSPAKTLAAARMKALELREEQDALWLDDLRPALADEGIKVVAVDEPSAARAARPGEALPAGGTAAPDADRRGRRGSVSLPPVAGPEPRGGGARRRDTRAPLRARERPQRPAALRRSGSRLLRRARGRDPPLPARGRRRGRDRGLCGLPDHARRRPLGRAGRRRPAAGGRAPAAAPPLRRGRPARARRRGAEAPGRAPQARARHRRRPDLHAPGAARARVADRAHRPRTSRAEVQAVAVGDAPALRQAQPDRALHADPAARHPRPASLRRLRVDGRGVRRRGARPEGDRPQGDRLPDRQPVVRPSPRSCRRPTTRSSPSASSS